MSTTDSRKTVKLNLSGDALDRIKLICSLSGVNRDDVVSVLIALELFRNKPRGAKKPAPTPPKSKAEATND